MLEFLLRILVQSSSSHEGSNVKQRYVVILDKDTCISFRVNESHQTLLSFDPDNVYNICFEYHPFQGYIKGETLGIGSFTAKLVNEHRIETVDFPDFEKMIKESDLSKTDSSFPNNFRTLVLEHSGLLNSEAAFVINNKCYFQVAITNENILHRDYEKFNHFLFSIDLSKRKFALVDASKEFCSFYNLRSKSNILWRSNILSENTADVKIISTFGEAIIPFTTNAKIKQRPHLTLNQFPGLLCYCMIAMRMFPRVTSVALHDLLLINKLKIYEFSKDKNIGKTESIDNYQITHENRVARDILRTMANVTLEDTWEDYD